MRSANYSPAMSSCPTVSVIHFLVTIMYSSLLTVSLLPEDDVEEVWDRILTDVFPDPSHRRSRADGVAIGHDLFLASNIPDILLSLDRANAFLVQSLSSLGVRRTERPHLFPFEDCAGYTDPSQRVQPYVTLTTVMELNRLVLAWPADMGQTLLHAMSNIAQVLRDQNRYPAFAEFVVCPISTLVITPPLTKLAGLSRCLSPLTARM